MTSKCGYIETKRPIALKGNSDTMYTFFKGAVILQISETKSKLFLKL